MHPILFEFPGLTFYTQTLCFFLAFLAGLFVAVHEGRRLSISRDKVTDIALWGFLGALLGARLFFLGLHHAEVSFNIKEVLTLGSLEGGFSFHGGLIGAGIVVGCLTCYFHLPLRHLADAFAPALALAMFFMRLGCLLNGCDYGIPADVPWALPLHGAFRHPIQLYEGIGNLLLFPLLLLLNRRPLKQGITFLTYLFVSGLLRFFVDFYREDVARIWAGCLFPQLLAGAIGLFAGFCLLASCFNKR